MDKENYYFLDGHFCLIDKKGKITKVPEETFNKLAPKAIIVLKDSIENIIDRLYKRDSIMYDHELIKLFQAKELNYSSEISKKLGVPYLECISSGEIDTVSRFIQHILNNNN